MRVETHILDSHTPMCREAHVQPPTRPEDRFSTTGSQGERRKNRLSRSVGTVDILALVIGGDTDGGRSWLMEFDKVSGVGRLRE